MNEKLLLLEFCAPNWSFQISGNCQKYSGLHVGLKIPKYVITLSAKIDYYASTSADGSLTKFQQEIIEFVQQETRNNKLLRLDVLIVRSILTSW